MTHFFCGGANPERIWHLKDVFVWLQAILGLKTNFGKLVPVGLVSNADALLDILGCRVSKLPMTYLGLPLGSTFKERAMWNVVIEKLERGFAALKRMHLSIGAE